MLGFTVTDPIRPLYIVELGATSYQLGFIMALPSIVSLFFRVPVSMVSDRFGGWRLMLCSIAISVFTTSIFAFIHDLIWFFPVVSLAALSWSVFSPISMAIVANQSTSNIQGTTMGMYLTSIGAAMFVGPLLSSLLTISIEFRKIFLLSTIFPLAALVIFLFIRL